MPKKNEKLKKLKIGNILTFFEAHNQTITPYLRENW